jgi:hypothetical protein
VALVLFGRCGLADALTRRQLLNIQHMSVQLPFDIVFLICQLIGSPFPPHTYTIDTATLYSLCLVARSFNEAASLWLYSSITLSNDREVKSIARTAQERPLLLAACHSLLCRFPMDSQWYIIRDITSSTPALRRFFCYGSQKHLRRLSQPPLESIVELSYPEHRMDISSVCNLRNIVNLERLIVKSIRFHKPVVRALLNMPRLTHVAMLYFEKTDLDSESLAGLSTLLSHPALQRIVFVRYPWAREDGMQEEILASLSKTDQAKVLFLHDMDYRGGPVARFIEWAIEGKLWELQ